MEESSKNLSDQEIKVKYTAEIKELKSVIEKE